MAMWQIVREPGRIAVAGELRIVDATAIWKALRAELAHSEGQVEVDLSRVTAIDGAIMSLVVEARRALGARGVACEIVGATEAMRALVHLYRGDEAIRPAPRPSREGAIARFGEATQQVARRVGRLVEFTGDLVASVATIVRRPATTTWRGLAALIERAGADGIPIVIVLDFLVGFVLAFQSTRQLKTYGATLYVADIVGVSMTRELAPLITAIIISGRSGAAYAAELGTMRVSEEIDALRTMGFQPMPYLVLPRIVALAIAAPILALVGDVAGVIGGLVVGASSLDVNPRAYLAELRTVLVASDIWTGLLKSFAFGIAIAFIGCQQGLATRGAASGVGRGTTATVVYCLFTLVIIDTIFTMVFRGFDV